MHYDYLIVGAGLFGSVFAQEMKKAGKKCLVIDKREHIAGNIYTKKWNDINVHWYGAHIFHTSNKLVWDYVNQFAEFNNYINSPVASYKDELYNLPFNMNTFSKMWGIKTPAEAKSRIEEQVRAARAEMSVQSANATGSENEKTDAWQASNLEEQALSMVGKDVYEKLIKGYTEKQWGRDCKDLPAFIIKRLPLRFTYDNNYFNDRYQGIPIGGYTQIIEKLLEGTEVLLNTDFKSFVTANKSVTDGDIESQCSWDKVLYTGMIDEYFDYQLGELEYRSLKFEHELIEGNESNQIDRSANYQGNAVVNYTEREVPYTRIIEHKHFEFGKQADTVITREYPASWQKGDEPYYPINDDRNTKLFAQYQQLAERETNVIFGGRLGGYKYYDMDKVIEAALIAVNTELAK